MHYCIYLLFRSLTFIFYMTPGWMLSVIYSIVYFIMYFLLRVRLNVVRKNIKICFPEMSEEARCQIVKKHYRYIARLLVDTLRMTTNSHEEAKNRIKITNFELLQSRLDQNKSVMLWTGHLGDIDALGVGGLFCSSYGVYKPLRNKYIDQWVRRNRAGFGTNLLSTKELKLFLKKHQGYDSQGQSCVFGLIADQRPGRRNSLPALFFDQKMDFFHGPELLAKRYDLPMFYISLQPEGDGFYTITFHELTKTLCFGDRTRQAVKLLERDIRSFPSYYYWMHNRWKHSE